MLKLKLKHLVLAVVAAATVTFGLAACQPPPPPIPCIFACYVATHPGCCTTPAPAPAPVPAPPVIIPVYVPPPIPVAVTPAPPPPPSPPLSNYWDPTRSQACIDLPLAQEWAADVANPNNVWVILYHGSVDNGTLISQQGLSLYMDDGDVPNATYVTRDYAAAHDAAWNPNHIPPYPLTYDRWIVGSKMPYYIWQHYFEPHEQPYTGWYPHTLQSTEALLGVASPPGAPIVYDTALGNIQIGLFNYGIFNWGYSL